jgi:hypothetical protein
MVLTISGSRHEPMPQRSRIGDMRTIRELVQVRKINQPTVQVNIGERQINVAGMRETRDMVSGKCQGYWLFVSSFAEETSAH